MIPLSIVLPCYNEAKSIRSIVERLDSDDQLDGKIEIILVNNGSTDNTSEVIDQIATESTSLLIKTVEIENNIGYGYGIISGINKAGGEVIAWTHADLQTDPLDVIRAFDKFKNHPTQQNCVLKGRRIGRNLVDAALTSGMGIMATVLLKTRLSDINAQPKMFHRAVLELLSSPPYDFSLDLYLLYQAKRNGMQILEYPVSFNIRKHGESKGGGTLRGKWKLILRTWAYMYKLKRDMAN